MAAEIEKAFGVKPNLVAGAGGVFNVEADGRLIFSKHQVSRFPEPGEVIKALGAKA